MPDQRAFQGDAFEQDAFQAPLVVDTGATIASGESWGIATVQRAARPVAAPSTEAFGTAKLQRTAAPAGIGSAGAFGTTAVRRVAQPTGITTGAAFGEVAITASVRPLSIGSSETFTAPSLTRLLGAVGSDSSEAFGVPQELQGGAPFSGVVAAGSISSSEAWGGPQVTLATQTGGSGLQHGINYIRQPVRHATPPPETPAARTVYATGIQAASSFGTPTVDISAPDSLQSRIAVPETRVADRDTLLLVGAL